MNELKEYITDRLTVERVVSDLAEREMSDQATALEALRIGIMLSEWQGFRLPDANPPWEAVFRYLVQVGESGWGDVNVDSRYCTGNKRVPFRLLEAIKEDLISFAEKAGLPVPGAWIIRPMVRRNAQASEQSQSRNSDSRQSNKSQLAVFQEMKNLTWDEVDILFQQAGRIIRVSARGKTSLMPYNEFGLMDKGRGKPNASYGLLLRLIKKERLTDSKKNKSTVSRLRRSMRDAFAIKSDPITHIGRAGYVLQFTAKVVPSDMLQRGRKVGGNSAIERTAHEEVEPDEYTDPDVGDDDAAKWERANRGR